jgi:alpha-mannosidase
MARRRRYLPIVIIEIAAALCCQAQTMSAHDIKKEPTLYVVPYAHLDTQWNWDFPQSISEFLLKTMRVNFDYFQKYPHYVFNWTGSNRYRLMKEYYPADYERVKQYVASGNWFPAGSSVEEGDVNLPGAESIFRQILYGNNYFRKEFGKASNEYMLPDCFGFPASIPTILAHAGVRGFSTQKLNSGWQPAPLVGGPGSPEETPEGIPFNVGLWEGPDGKTVLAALNPGSYVSVIRSDLSKSPVPNPDVPTGRREEDWPARIDRNGKLTGVFADYHYVGTGDIGGAVDEESVRLLEATVTKGEAVVPPPQIPGKGTAEQNANQSAGVPVRMGDGPVHVISSAANQMFSDIKPDMTLKMPRYKGDLELINHSAGSLTSEAYHKRWNRKNEILADAAEKASVAADWMGGRPYPLKRINDAWTLVMGGQFHDTAAGTANPRAYEFAQNDDLIALNQFAGVLTSATQAISSALNTESKGIPVVVYNSLNIAREDVVEASINFPGEQPKGVRVIGPDGQEVPAQIENGKVLFLAKTPSVGYAVYDVRSAISSAQSAILKVTGSSLENARYQVKLDQSGDVTSIFDKLIGKELLASPLRLAISTDTPRMWPAWNMDFDQEQAAPRSYVSGPATIRISEDGPVRIAVEVSRQAEGSKFVQTVRLSAGDAGNRVEFTDSIDWNSKSANLKAVFPLTASNKTATYSWDVGTVQRPTAAERQFEVGSHHWVDLTDESGSFGATILTDVKNASDKRDDHTIRLTLLRTPGFLPQETRRSHSDELSQDWGHHEILFGITGHAGDWRQGQTDWQALRLSTPLVSFETTSHTGVLGRNFSLVTISDPRIRMLALKKAELSDEIIVRLVEMDGKPTSKVRVKFTGPIGAAREVNGQEQPIGPASVVDGALETSFTAYQPRTFALTLGAPRAKVAAVRSRAVTLSYDLAASSNDDTTSLGGFSDKGDALPAELLPSGLTFDGVEFQLAPAGTGKLDAVVAKGQTIDLPSGDFNKVYVLAASSDGDQKATFRVGAKTADVTIQAWNGFIGQADTRIWKPAPDTVRKDWAVSANHATWDLKNRGSVSWSPRYPEDYLGLTAGYVKRADIAWYASHHHTAAGLNEPYEYSYLFAYALDLPVHSNRLTLPTNDKLRILAISVASQEPDVSSGQPLYDTLGRTEPGSFVSSHSQP